MLLQMLLAVAVVGVTMAYPGGYDPVYPSEPLPYQFDYAVHDDYKGTNFGQKEKSDGKNVHGSYTVDLPDGRRQTVDYTADHYKGFVAKVSYEGQAKHPAQYGPPITFQHGGEGYH
ncbi:pupal cuticle protein Edg-84A [Procambarus clarkii]|uniref:pupal cuticle protein Edg-84A n=1 Tax=Procambarus clarkii TaxID=6728 RepID=UPI001E672E67|nr:pupal cuticle protein Edg-84A-like [Procambarus clarkii]